MARRAREGKVAPTSFESPSSASLSLEFEAALVAIVAVSFAMEALDKELESVGHRLDKSRFTAPKHANRGFYIAQRVAQAFELQDATAARFTTDLVSLFELRNSAAHFESELREGMHPHPSGTNTALELTIYTLEQAEEAVRLGRDVIAEGAAAVNDGRICSEATDLSRELPGVVRMLGEVMAAAGL